MKLERILSETNFPDSSNSSLEQPVLVHCLLCLSFSQSTQYSSVDWPILTPLDLPPPSPPCRGASRRRFQAKVPRHVQPVGRSVPARAAVSQRASQSLPVGLQSSSRLVEFQTVLHAVWICSWRSLLRPSQSRKTLLVPRKFAILQSSMISDSDAGPKIRDVQLQLLRVEELSRRELYYTTILTRKNHPLASSCCCCWYYTQYGSAPIDCIYEG